MDLYKALSNLADQWDNEDTHDLRIAAGQLRAELILAEMTKSPDRTLAQALAQRPPGSRCPSTQWSRVCARPRGHTGWHESGDQQEWAR